MKILLIKLNHIGDALLLTPTIRFLRTRYPEMELDVVVRKGCEPVLEGNADITHLIGIASPERRRRSLMRSILEFIGAFRLMFCKRYDYAFDLSNSDRAKFWIFLSRARNRVMNDWEIRLGWKGWVFNHFNRFAWGMEHMVLKDFRTVADLLEPDAVPGPLILNTAVDASTMEAALPFLGSSTRFAVIHPTSRWKYKQWHLDRWSRVADWLKRECGLEVVFSCGPDGMEVDHIETILSAAVERHHTTRGRLSLRETAYLIQRGSIFLGVDTVAMHMAAAVQTPVVALFGPSSEWSWRPWQCRHEVVLGDCSCKLTRKFICDKSRIYPCMGKISVSAVQDAAQRLLADVRGDS